MINIKQLFCRHRYQSFMWTNYEGQNLYNVDVSCNYCNKMLKLGIWDDKKKYWYYLNFKVKKYLDNRG